MVIYISTHLKLTFNHTAFNWFKWLCWYTWFCDADWLPLKLCDFGFVCFELKISFHMHLISCQLVFYDCISHIPYISNLLVAMWCGIIKWADSLFCECRHKLAFLEQRNFNWQFAQQKNNHQKKNAARVIYISIVKLYIFTYNSKESVSYRNDHFCWMFIVRTQNHDIELWSVGANLSLGHNYLKARFAPKYHIIVVRVPERIERKTFIYRNYGANSANYSIWGEEKVNIIFVICSFGG